MRFSVLLATLGVGALLAATPPAPLKPVLSLPLSKTEKFDGAIALPNQSTLVFIPNGEKNAVRVVALSAAGQRLWESSVVKTSHNRGLTNLWKTMHGGDMETRTLLAPLQAYSTGNTVFTCEAIGKDNPMKLPEGQLVVQRIDEQGKVTRHDFAQPAPPKRTERELLARYADADALFMTVKYTNTREETATYFLESYNPATKKSQQLPLDLPKPYVTKHEDQSYHDWIMVGHRRGRTYFYRALRGTTAKDNPNKIAVEYEFRIFDNSAKLVNSFTTALHAKLQPSTYINYSGYFGHAPAQSHVGEIITKGNGRSYYVFDTFDVSTGGLGEFYLDPDSEDIYLAGEYGSKIFTVLDYEDVLGTFVCKLTPDGTVVQLVQNPYPAEIKKDSKFLLSSFDRPRRATLFVNALTHDLNLGFVQDKRSIVVNYDANLQLVKYHNLTFKEYPRHNLWVMGQSYTTSSTMGYPMMEIPRQYATAQGGYYQKLLDLAGRTSPATKEKGTPLPLYYCQPKEGALVIRAIDQVGARVDIYAL